MESLAGNIAKNIQYLRREQGLTQARLATRAGLPRTTVTHLESGSGNPTLNSVHALATALQVSIEELLAAPRPAVALFDPQDIKVVERSGGKVKMNKLLPDPIPGMEIDRLTIKPQARLRGVPHLAGTKEYLFVDRGELQVFVDGEHYLVGEGALLAFPGDCAHSYHNPGRKIATGFSVVALAPG